MKSINRLGNVVSKTRWLPKGLRRWTQSKIFGNTVKFVGTSGIRFDELQFDNIKLSIANKTKVQNHIGGVHAAATALLGETASGFIVGMHVPDSRLPLLKTMTINYVKRASGNLVATASLTQTQIDMIRNTEKGELVVPVTVTDEKGNEPVEAEFVWAWIPKQRK